LCRSCFKFIIFKIILLIFELFKIILFKFFIFELFKIILFKSRVLGRIIYFK
jgi:hypothetical protein